MMRELADNILDIAQNSIAAGASLVTITIDIETERDRIVLRFEDNGRGMSADFVKTVAEPFTTTRTTRKVGLGLPLLKQTAQMTGGEFSIRSQIGVGTVVTASFGLRHIDRPPLGNVAGTLFSLVILNPHLDFVIVYRLDGQAFTMDTRQIKQMVAPLSITNPELSAWIKDYIQEGINSLHGGASFI